MNAKQREEWRALDPVRGAIRGWAFADASGLASRLLVAERLVAALPAEHRKAGEGLLFPLRQRKFG